MLISSDNLFPGMSTSCRGKGAIKKVVSELESGEGLTVFDSLLEKKIPENQTVDKVEEILVSDETNNMAGFFSKINDGIETGIRLSLPDFIKKSGKETSISSQSVVLADAGVSPSVEVHEGATFESGRSQLLFALSCDQKDKKAQNDKTSVFEASRLGNPGESLEKKKVQSGIENREIADVVSLNLLEERNFSLTSTVKVDPVDSLNTMVLPVNSEAVFEPADLHRGEAEVLKDVLPPDFQVFDELKRKIVIDDKVSSVNPILKEKPDSQSELDINDPEILSLQVNSDLAVPLKRMARDDFSVAVSSESVDLENMDLSEGRVPLVENPFLSEIKRRNATRLEENIRDVLPVVSPVDVSSDLQKSVKANHIDSVIRNNVNIVPPEQGEKSWIKEADIPSLPDAKENPLPEALPLFSDSGNPLKTLDIKGNLQTIPLQRGPAALSDGVVNVVKFINSRGETRAQVIVDPPAIGKVHIELHATPEGMEANLRVDSFAVRDMIKNQIPLLQDMLAQQGISLSEMNVDVHSGDSNKGQWGDKSGSRRRFSDENEETGPEFTAKIDLEQGLLVWTA